MPTTYPYSCSNSATTIQFDLPNIINNSIVAGTALTISGRIKSTARVTALTANVKSGSSTLFFLTVSAEGAIAKADAWGKFTMTADIPASSTHTQAVTLSFAVTTGSGSANIAASQPSLIYYGYQVSPRVATLKFTRCDGSGNPAEDGNYLRCDELVLTVAPGRSISDITSFTYSDNSAGSTPCTMPTSLTHSDSGAPSSSWLLGDNTFANGVTHKLDFRLTAGIEVSSYTVTVERSFAKLHISGYSEGGVAIGGFSRSNEINGPCFEVAENHKSYFPGGIEGISNFNGGENDEICGIFHSANGDRKIHRFVTGAKYPYDVAIPNYQALDQVLGISCIAHMQNGNWRPIDAIINTNGAVSYDNTNTTDAIAIVYYTLLTGK